MEILQQTFQELGAYLPKVIAAVVVLILGWLLACILSSIVARTLGRVKLDDKMSSGMGGEYHASRLISQSVFWLVIFLFVS